jgi:HAMP domain-containing protein
MTKIPVKIVELTSPSGKSAVDVMIDMYDYNEIENVQKKIKKFKKKYFELVKKAEQLFFGSNLGKTRSKNLTSSTCWKLGNLFQKFDSNIKNDFIITNYSVALERDFGRSNRYIRELIIFSKLFKEKEIIDSVPMAIYRALVWKKNQLDEIGILEKEKNRLIEMGKNNNAPGREEYKIELINAIKFVQSKSRGK